MEFCRYIGVVGEMRSKILYEGNSYSLNRNFYPMMKRLMEIVFTLVLLILTLPVLGLAAVAIKIESRGPVFYKQERMGLNGKLFFITKLRSMVTDAEKDGPQWASRNDPRVTRVGKFLRKTRIDEVPQIFNVLRGDMSLIGPRPERSYFIEKFSREIPGFKKRLLVKPGLTGWAQVNGGYESTPAEKFELDMFYIKRQSLSLDMKILFKTVGVVLTGSGAR